MGILYLLTFSSGKKYVGQTTRTLKRRIQAHRNAAGKGSPLAVHLAWAKHGEPMVEVLGEYDTQEALSAAEIAAIQSWGTLSPNGYNISYGGDTAPSKNPEVKKKISATSKGRKFSQEVKEKMATLSRSHWQDPDYRAKVLAGVAESWTDEKRAERSVISKTAWAKRKADGWTMPESTKEKLRQKKASPETLEKMRLANLGKKHGQRSAETKAMMSESGKASWANPEHAKKRGEAISAALRKRYENMTPEQRQAFIDLCKKAGQTRRQKRNEAAKNVL